MEEHWLRLISANNPGYAERAPTIFMIVAFVTGIAAHQFYFKIGERFLFPFAYVQFYLLLFGALGLIQTHVAEIPARLAVQQTAALAGLHLSGLYLSLITFRLFFNPLNKIPGPFGARLSRLAFTFSLSDFNSNYKLLELHKKYGPFVRVGPNDLSVAHPDAVPIILGPNSVCSKAQWYAQDKPLTSMHTTRDRAMHDRRRRIWSPAFSDKSLRGYEPRVQVYNDQLLEQIEKHAGQPMDVSTWFNLYSFDVMGELGLGQSFDMIKEGKPHWAIKLLNAGMDPIGFNLPPWLFRTLVAIPGAAADYFRFIGFCSQQLDARMKVQGKKSNPDITHHLIDHFNKLDDNTKKTTLPMLQGDARLIIVAGSDTTAATLVHMFCYLAKDQDMIVKLRKELKSLIGDDGKINHGKIQDAPLLNGSINEALRLNPPVPSGVFRKTPKEGIKIDGTYIAGNTVIQIPNYVLGHDDNCFAQADKFIPERWSTKNELMKHEEAFAPFSIGPYGCIGKNLALMEIRLLTSQILLKYDVKFAPGEDGSKLLYKTADHFTLGLKELNLIFTPRDTT